MPGKQWTAQLPSRMLHGASKTFKPFLPKVEIHKPQDDKWLKSDSISRSSRVIKKDYSVYFNR